MEVPKMGKEKELLRIDGYTFDVAKAKLHYQLELLDANSNFWRGEAYLSSKDTWYVKTPAQWSNLQYWKVLGKGKEGAEELLDEYADFLTNEEREEIAKKFNLKTE
jgi:phosphatidylserine decarboxylase